MKVITSPELRSRLTNAAANGSRIAQDVLQELKGRRDASEVLKGSVNYFSTKRIKGNADGTMTVRVYFTACTKDVTNDHFPDRDNPQAPWFSENRTDLEPSTFLGYFKNLPQYSETELNFFASAICLDSRVTVKMYSRMSDLHEAYYEANYIPVAQKGCMSLHNSCMRYEDVSRNAADFYYNFAGAKMIVAKDAANNILARAVVWENAVMKSDVGEVPVSVLDRVYFSYSFLLNSIYDYAASTGIMLRKTHNDYQHAQSFCTLNPIPTAGKLKGESLEDVKIHITAIASRWHKYGAPYLDTFSELHLADDASLELWNYKGNRRIASLRSTGGLASKERNMCPGCGKVHEANYYDLCEECRKSTYVKTVFGDVLTGHTIKYKDQTYPSFLFRRGRPLPFMNTYLQLQKLY